MVEEPELVAAGHDVDAAVLECRLVEVQLHGDERGAVVNEEGEVLVPRGSEALPRGLHHQHRVIEKDVRTEEVLDCIEDPRVARERHPFGCEFVRLCDLLYKSAAAVVAERLQLEPIGALGEAVRARGQAVECTP